ncbi:MAG: ABC transporter permease [Firmicutes bacterium]|nr:ABC transporter permease [Bacillota bacterium]
MRKVFTVIREEFKMTAANRAFIILTILGPFLIAAITILPGLLASKAVNPEKEYQIGVYAQDANFVVELGETLKARKIILRYGEDLEVLKKRVSGGELEGLLVIPDDYMEEKVFSYYTKQGGNLFVSEAIQGVLGGIIVSKRLASEGLDPGRIAHLTARPSLKTMIIDQEGKEKNQDVMEVLLIALTFAMMIYMTVILYGQSIGRSVLMEKTSKTVEILLSSVSSSAIMFGKIIGKGWAAILQSGIWVTMAIFIVKIVGPKFGLVIPAALSVTNFLYLFSFFILAFFLYAAIYAALGAAAEDEQHLNQLLWPVLICLIVPMVMISSIIFNPESRIAIFFSFFPFTAPLVMLIRVLVAAPPYTEILLCYGLLIATIGIMVILSTRIFRVGILMTGKKFNFKQILSWLWQ